MAREVECGGHWVGGDWGGLLEERVGRKIKKSYNSRQNTIFCVVSLDSFRQVTDEHSLLQRAAYRLAVACV